MKHLKLPALRNTSERMFWKEASPAAQCTEKLSRVSQERDIYSHEGTHVRATERPSVLEALMEPSHGWHVWSAAGYEKPVRTGENKF